MVCYLYVGLCHPTSLNMLCIVHINKLDASRVIHYAYNYDNYYCMRVLVINYILNMLYAHDII